MSFIHDVLEAEHHKAQAYKLYVVNRRYQTPHLVSLAAVYGIPRDAELDVVREQLNTLRTMLIDRTFDMARFEKRFPVTGILANEHYCEQDRLIDAFKLCCWCRPPGVIYPPKTQKKKIRLCGHYNYCPACWARVVEHQFRQYERLIAALAGSNPLSRLYATTHITEQFVPFVGIDPLQHADVETYNRAVDVISRELSRYKRYIACRRKQINRKTEAALWRLVPVATEGGWRIQLRQIFLTLPGTRPPAASIRLAQTVFKQTTLVTASVNDDAIISFIAFSSYPQEHLREDLDLTAASLNAMSNQNMLGGSGKFRSAGNALIVKARQETKTAKQNGSQKTA
jgi:hypothetical protein